MDQLLAPRPPGKARMFRAPGRPACLGDRTAAKRLDQEPSATPKSARRDAAACRPLPGGPIRRSAGRSPRPAGVPQSCGARPGVSYLCTKKLHDGVPVVAPPGAPPLRETGGEATAPGADWNNARRDGAAQFRGPATQQAAAAWCRRGSGRCSRPAFTSQCCEIQNAPRVPTQMKPAQQATPFGLQASLSRMQAGAWVWVWVWRLGKGRSLWGAGAGLLGFLGSACSKGPEQEPRTAVRAMAFARTNQRVKGERLDRWAWFCRVWVMETMISTGRQGPAAQRHRVKSRRTQPGVAERSIKPLSCASTAC